MNEKPDLSFLQKLLRRGELAVPAVRFATGVVGVAAAAAIVSFVLGRTRATVVLMALIFMAMVLLFLFSRLVSDKRSKSIRAAAHVVLWTVASSFCVALLLCVTAITIHWPPRFADFLFPDNELTNSALIQRVVTKESITEAIDAVNTLASRCRAGCRDRDSIIATLKTALRQTRHLDRELNVSILAALKSLTNRDLRSVLHDELMNRELVSVDLADANLSGLTLRGAFAILSEFRNADLSSADLSDTRLRGSNFRGAILKNASLANADWFNSFGLEPEQLADVAGPVLPCPIQKSPSDFAPFIQAVNKRYVLPFENYAPDHQQLLIEHWRRYTSSRGACEVVRKRAL